MSLVATRMGGEVKVLVDIPHARRVQLSCKGHALRLQLVPTAGREPLETAMLDPQLKTGPCNKASEVDQRANALQVSFAGEQGVASSDGAITVSRDGVVTIRKQGRQLLAQQTRAAQVVL